jgi:membrane protease YdiL (CAAX protease family)
MQFKAIWANNSPASKFLLAIGMVIVGAFLFTLVSFGLSSALYGVSPAELEGLLHDLDNPITISVLKLIQTISEIGTFILPALFLAYAFDNSASHYLRLDKKADGISVVAVFAMLIAAVPVINFLGELNSRMVLPDWLAGLEQQIKASEEEAGKLTEKFLQINSVMQFIYAMVMIAVLPALGEELLFRGILQRIFSEWSRNKHTGVWATAILFSAMHMQFYGFVPRMLLGVMLGYLYFWSGSLWLPILAHFINNGAAVIATYLYRQHSISVNPDTIGTEQDYLSLLISVVLTAALLWFIYRRERFRNPGNYSTDR